MTPEEKRAYARGYNSGAKWPLHKPPHPPEKLVSDLMVAALKLRNAVDGEIAKLCPDDEWQTVLGDPIDDVDAAIEAIGSWLKRMELAEAI